MVAERVGKVVFADQLRGVAALLVVLSHLFNVYYGAQPLVSAIAAVPPVALAPLWINEAMALRGISFGPFGVGLFFLVSGFVVPFSLRRHTRGRFLLARALRIYPTYVAALAIGCGLVWLSGRYWGLPVPFGRRAVLANAGLLHTLLHVGSLDQVNWTLVIELHFYLFAALFRPLFLRGSLWPMAAAVLGAFAFHLVQAAGWVGRPSFLELEAMSLPFMLIGTVFSHHFSGRLQAAVAWPVVAALSAVVLVLHRISAATGGDMLTAWSYGWALLLFVAAYAFRDLVPDLAPLRWLALVSYPLYAVHLLAAFTAMTWLIAGPPGWSYGWAGLAALGLMFGLAWVLHRLIERPTVRMGSALGTRS